jgi:multidrug resistance efflux pump
MDQASAKIERLIAGPRKQEITAAEAELQLAEAELEPARADFERTKTLVESRVRSSESLDQATESLRVAEARVRVRREELSKLREGTRQEEIAEAAALLEEARQAWKLLTAGYRAEEIAKAEASAQAGAAVLRGIERQIEELSIVAPLDATVEAVELQPGDLVGPNAPVISLSDRSNLWVRAYLPENRLDIQLGQKLKITVDSFPDERFMGHVSFLARRGAFVPGNVQTPEERSKQVFRIKVTLDEGLDRLLPGMAADVWLDGAPE